MLAHLLWRRPERTLKRVLRSRVRPWTWTNGRRSEHGRPVRIGCASGFWGDTATSVPQLIHGGKLDFLVFDYLSEITMSLLTAAKSKAPNLGYAPDFVLAALAPSIRDIQQKGVRVVSNAGGVNPLACADAIREVVRKAGLDLKVAVVTGDDLTPQRSRLARVETADGPRALPEKLHSVNAYLGAGPIRRCLDLGADIVVTGRCVDSALALGPLMHAVRGGWRTGRGGWPSSATERFVAFLAVRMERRGLGFAGRRKSGGSSHRVRRSEHRRDLHRLASRPRLGRHRLPRGGMFLRRFLRPLQTAEDRRPGVVRHRGRATGVRDRRPAPIRAAGRHLRLQPRAHPGSARRGWRRRPGERRQRFGAAARLQGVRHLHGRISRHRRVSAGRAQSGGKGPQDRREHRQKVAFWAGSGGSVSETRAGLRRTRRIFKRLALEDFTDIHVQVLGAEDTYGAHAANKGAREAVLWLAACHKDKKALEVFAREIAPAGTGMAPGLCGIVGGRPRVSPILKPFFFYQPKSQVQIHIHVDGHLAESFSEAEAHTPHEEAPLPSDGEEVDLDLPSGPHCYRLEELAYTRSGDKGDSANIGVIARDPRLFPYLKKHLTSSAVEDYLLHLFPSGRRGAVTRYTLPGINALNFLLKDCLGGGGVASLRSDPQGKALAQMLLDLELDGLPDLAPLLG
ncbi:uncharacterized protein LOC144066198 isoform X1 [Stigmatopora argus]